MSRRTARRSAGGPGRLDESGDFTKGAQLASNAIDAILRLLEDRGVQYTTWDGWMALDEHEKSLGAAAVDADGEPRARIKVVEREEMVRVSREGAPQPTHA